MYMMIAKYNDNYIIIWSNVGGKFINRWPKVGKNIHINGQKLGQMYMYMAKIRKKNGHG
jgi:hypothetical protein